MSNGVFNFYFLVLLLSKILGVPNLHQGTLCPLDAPSGEIFVPKASTSQYLIVFLILTFQLQYFLRFQGIPIFTLGGPVPPCTPLNGIFFVHEARTLLSLMAFLISTFQLQYFPGYQGGPKFTLGGRALPGGPLAKNNLTCAQVLAYIYITVNFQLPSSIHAGLAERSLYNRFEKSAKMWFLGDFGRRG